MVRFMPNEMRLWGLGLLAYCLYKLPHDNFNSLALVNSYYLLCNEYGQFDPCCWVHSLWGHQHCIFWSKTAVILVQNCEQEIMKENKHNCTVYNTLQNRDATKQQKTAIICSNCFSHFNFGKLTYQTFINDSEYF